MGIITRFIATTLAVWIVTFLPLQVVVSGGEDDNTWSRVLVFLGVGGILTAVNAFIKPIVNFVTAPIRLLTLGLFSLIVNWGMLTLASWITSKFSFGSLELNGGFWRTLGAALVITIVAWLIGKLVPKRKKEN